MFIRFEGDAVLFSGKAFITCCHWQTTQIKKHPPQPKNPAYLHLTDVDRA